MNYPTIPEVEAASRLQLARWKRFLPSPGPAPDWNAQESDYDDYKRIANEQIAILDRIQDRLLELGGPQVGVVVKDDKSWQP